MALADLLIKVGANVEEYMTAMDAVVSKASDAMDRVEDRFASLSNVGEALAKVGAGLTAAITVPIVGIGGAALKAAADMEQAKIGFTTLLRSGDAAAEMLAKLRDFAAKTPFNFPELVTGAQRLLAMGTSAQDLIPKMTAIGNATAAMGRGIETFDGIALALSQMGNSAKATAQDMNQLIQRGIDPYKFLAESSGKSVGEIRKNLGELFTGAEASQIILAGMTKQFAGAMDAQSKSLTGMWSNVQDAIKFTLADIGSTLLPTAKMFVENFVVPMLEGVKSIAHWFAELPEPVKMGALAIAGLAAVIGPVLLAIGALGMALPAIATGLTAIAGVTGLAIGPMLGIAAAVAGAVVALAALGTWVADNWGPIKATVMQAWEGVSDVWSAAWKSIAAVLTGNWSDIGDSAKDTWGTLKTFFQSYWEGIEAQYFIPPWTSIKDFLLKTWEEIRKSADTVFGFSISAALNSFIDTAKKIPGVNKLLNLDEAWDSAKKLAAEQKTLAGELKKVSDVVALESGVLGGLAAPIKTATAGIQDHTKAIKEVHQWYTKWGEVQKAHAIATYENTEAVNKAEREISLLNQQITKGEGPLQDWTSGLASAKVEINRLTPDMETFNRVMSGVAKETAKSADALGDAFKRQRITSSTELKATAEQAQRDLDTISNSHRATQGEVDAAWHAMMEAEIAYRRRMGDDVAPLEAELAKYDNAHKNLQKRVKDTWQLINEDINRAIDDFGRNISDLGRDLLSGDFSLSKVGDAFKQLGLDIAQTFLDVGARAITTFIKEHIGALLNALGSVVDKISGVGSDLGSLGGMESTGIGAIDRTIATVGGGAAQGGAGAATKLGGAGTGGTTGMLGSVLGFAGLGVSIASGIVSGIQGARTNNLLAEIEESTRYAKGFLYGQIELGLQYWPQIENIRDFLWTVAHDAWVEIISETQKSHDWLKGMTDILSDLRNLAIDLRTYATGTFEIIRDEIVTRLAGTNQTGETAAATILDVASLNIDTEALGSVISTAIGQLGATIKANIANITLSPTIDASGQLSTLNNTVSGISMMLSRSLGFSSPMAPAPVAAGAMAGGWTINIDLRGSTLSGTDMVDRLANEITDRIRRITR